MQNLLPGVIYRHFRSGQRYQIITTARHTETQEEMVVYKALYHSEQFVDQSIWVRPKAMFLENVMHEGKSMPRFSLEENK